jgi:carbon storage regulator
MLILSRRIGETLRIGSNVTVTVVGVKGNYVRIGISAPASVPVHREELYERIRRGTAPLRVNQAPSLRVPLKQRPISSRDSPSGSVRSKAHGTRGGVF